MLGRNRDSTLVLQDRHASRRHARVFFRNGSWFISDQQTTNGTRIGGQRIHGDTPLQDGQVIAIGELRLRFHIARDRDRDENTPPVEEQPPPPAAPIATEAHDTTLFQVDELTALFRFMNDSLAEATPGRLVALALEAALRQTGAEMAGFLSLDDHPDLRLVLPQQASVDWHLSHQLTQAVLREGRSVWLCSPQSSSLESDSLSNFHDAVCVPLRVKQPGANAALEAPLGALHVYKTTRPFTDRQVRFLEVLAGSLAGTLHVVRSRRALEADNSRLRVHVAAASDYLVGSSPQMCTLRQQVARLADAPCTVLIHGESGVGKELVALALHRQSGRHRGPLVTVNCAAIAGGMAESELFGHVKGAFTGAVRDHQGYFAQADMGTLFLDELGELSLDLQAKLLRAIEYRLIRPVGARGETRVDVRILVATNRDLRHEVREGRFRADLFFRLNSSQINVPPLRERIEDVPELVQHFLDHFSQEYRKRVTLSEGAMVRLQGYPWPGNVRQLRSALEGALAMAPENGTIHASDLHLPVDDLSAPVSGLPPSLNLEELEKWAIRNALAHTAGNTTQAASLLGVHRCTLIEKRKKYRIG
jgi:transcriptional regulator with GAF, ATPase, and Fis domain